MSSNQQPDQVAANATAQTSDQPSQPLQQGGKSRGKLLAIGIIAASIGASAVLIMFKPVAEPKQFSEKLPSVSTLQVQPKKMQIPVYSRGIIKPRQEVQLVSQVTGEVLEVNRKFAAGGFVKKGELLLKVDRANYLADQAKTRASLSASEVRLAQIEARARISSRGRDCTKDRLGCMIPQLNESRSSVKASKAALDLATRQLQKTSVRAPFDGRVRQAVVSQGQFVTTGLTMGIIYATDFAEVRLPLTDNMFSVINLPNDQTLSEDAALVTLKSGNGREDYFWQGKLVRTEASIDPQTRLIHVVAQISRPFTQDKSQPNRPPLNDGMYLEAQIAGRWYEGVYEIPRQALRNGHEVWLLDDDKLRVRPVSVLYRGKQNVYIDSGLSPNDKIVMTQLDSVVDGMQVIPVSNSESEQEKNSKPANPKLSSPKPSLDLAQSLDNQGLSDTHISTVKKSIKNSRIEILPEQP